MIINLIGLNTNQMRQPLRLPLFISRVSLLIRICAYQKFAPAAPLAADHRFAFGASADTPDVRCADIQRTGNKFRDGQFAFFHNELTLRVIAAQLQFIEHRAFHVVPIQTRLTHAGTRLWRGRKQFRNAGRAGNGRARWRPRQGTCCCARQRAGRGCRDNACGRTRSGARRNLGWGTGCGFC